MKNSITKIINKLEGINSRLSHKGKKKCSRRLNNENHPFRRAKNKNNQKTQNLKNESILRDTWDI